MLNHKYGLFDDKLRKIRPIFHFESGQKRDLIHLVLPVGNLMKVGAYNILQTEHPAAHW